MVTWAAVPEGDTVHRWANPAPRLAVADTTLERVEIRRATRGQRIPAPGVRVVDVEARGKHLLVRFDDGAVLHTHMKMHGVWHVYGKGERWRRPAYKARVVLQADNGVTAVCFDAPVVELRRDDTFRPRTRAGAALDRLGPNLCDETVDLDEVLRRARGLAARDTDR